MLALRRMGPVYVMGQRTGSSLGFLSTATGAYVLSIASVPLGSELSLRFDDSLVDVRVVNGSAEDLSIEALANQSRLLSHVDKNLGLKLDVLNLKQE